jgi:hypothetical protein
MLAPAGDPLPECTSIIDMLLVRAVSVPCGYLVRMFACFPARRVYSERISDWTHQNTILVRGILELWCVTRLLATCIKGNTTWPVCRLHLLLGPESESTMQAAKHQHCALLTHQPLLTHAARATARMHVATVILPCLNPALRAPDPPTRPHSGSTSHRGACCEHRGGLGLAVAQHVQRRAAAAAHDGRRG